MHIIEGSDTKILHTYPIEEFLIRLIVAAAGSLLIGYIFFQSAIFDIHDQQFQFVALGVFGGVFYLLLSFFNTRNAIASYVIIAFILQAVIPKPFTFQYIVRDLTFYSLAGIAIYSFWKYPFTGNHARIMRPLQLAGFLTLSAITDTIILMAIDNRWEVFGYALYTKCRLLCLIGIGLGIGIETGEKVYQFYFEQNYGESEHPTTL